MRVLCDRVVDTRVLCVALLMSQGSSDMWL